MKIELISYPTDKDWMLCKKCTLVTVGKDSEKAPTEEWKHKLLKARHSPIRELRFVFRLTDIPYWVSVHLCRHHVGCQPYVKTQRNDRQSDYDRESAPQNSPVDMMWSMNADALITIANKRLCFKASEQTRLVVAKMCSLVVKACPEFKGLLAPQCVLYGTCNEMVPCDNMKENLHNGV